MDPVNYFEALFKQNSAASWTPSVPLGHEGQHFSWVFLKRHTFPLEEVWVFWFIGNVSHHCEPSLQSLFLPRVEGTPH